MEFATIVFGAVVTSAVQEVVRRINNNKNINKLKLTNCADSIQEKVTRVSREIRDYQQRHKDTSDPWRENVAQWRRLMCKVEDCVDKFMINKINAEQFAAEISGIEKELLGPKSTEIEAYIRENEKASPSAPLQGQHDSPDNHAGISLVGIEEPLQDLLTLVLGNSKKQCQAKADDPKVISIVGSRGIGKTCLASQVYFDKEVEKSFPLRAFVSATGKHKDAVVQEVRQELHKQGQSSTPQARCLVVVDDVHDREVGTGIRRELRNVTTAGVVIIMTTTIQSFAQSWSHSFDDHVYKMRPLVAELSTILFRAHYPHGVMPKSEEFGEGCDDGVPLAVITWAGYWEQDHHGCKTVWSKFGNRDWLETLEKMERALKHSYDSLADNDLQTCLLYFSLFRHEEDGVRRGSLIRRWEAEGGEVGCRDLISNRKHATESWKMLVDRNILCPVQVSINEEDQGAKTCRPSGAMLGYIMSHKSRSEEGFARVCSDEQLPGQVIRRLSLQACSAQVLEDEGAVSRLRTLVVTPENNNEIKAADLSFDKCRLLRVLDLEACSGPERISIAAKVCNKLKLLRYLSLRSAFIGYVPQEITQLKMLETLDVGKEKVVEVHVDVMLLPKLKHLVGKLKLKTSSEFFFNKQKFEAKHLETLAGFVTLNGNGFPQLMTYKSIPKHQRKLRKVKVFFDPNASAKSLSTRLADAITAFLPESANHSVEGERRILSIDIQECKQTWDVLRSLENAQGTLYSLKLCGTSDLKSFPSSFIAKLKGIEKLCLSFGTLSWQSVIDGQDGLLHLKYLKLVAKEPSNAVGVPNQPTAGSSTTTVVEVLRIKEGQFKNLERMCLDSKRILPKIEIEDGALTKLVSLHLISWGIGKPDQVICNSKSTNGIPPVNNPTNKVAHEIPPLMNLKEVALRSSLSVNKDTKKAWHEAAWGHPRRPQVIFM